MKLKVKTHCAPWSLELEFVVSEDLLDSIAVLKAGVWEKRDGHEPYRADDIWRMPMDRGRALLDAFAEAAWELGWRPDGHKTEDASAMKAHLEDMRRLVFEPREPTP